MIHANLHCVSMIRKLRGRALDMQFARRHNEGSWSALVVANDDKEHSPMSSRDDRMLISSMSRRRSRRRLLAAMATGWPLAVIGNQLPARAQDGAATATPCPASTPEEAIAVTEAYFEAFNAGDAEALGELLADDYTHQGALVSQQDREVHKERLRTNRKAFPDGHYDVQDVLADGDLVMVRHVFTGTLQAPYAGVEPQGQQVAVRGVHIHHVACGKIVETWNNGDGLGLLRQIGAHPAGPASRAPQHASTPAASPVASCPPGTAEENTEIGRRWTEEALDTHQLDVLDQFVAEDIVHHAGLYRDEIGRDALKGDLAALIAVFPAIRFTADVVVATDSQAAVRWTGRGTNNGEFQGQPPTGKGVEFTGTNVYRIACGEIVEGWSEPDSLGLLQKLGVVPAIQPVITGMPEA
jgi:steroid delta-isomerase-like uncharacterized protein